MAIRKLRIRLLTSNSRRESETRQNKASRTSNYLRTTLSALIVFGTVVEQTFSQQPNVPVTLAASSVRSPVPRSYFAMNMAGSAWKHPWPTVDVGAVRIFDSAWPPIEPQRGQWDFSHLDQDVREAQKRHIDIDFVLGHVPTWASARPYEANPYPWQKPGARAEPKDMAEWEDYVRHVATRYKGVVFTYEMWNEPNMKDSYSGDIPHLVELCKAAYRVLKQVDPRIQVISPSPAPSSGADYLRSFIGHGGGDTFDVLGFHFYDDLAAKMIHPESVLSAAQQLRTTLNKRGFSEKAIWNTESGYYISSDPSAKYQAKEYPSYAHVLSQEESVAAIGRSYIIGWAAGIERFYWYGWGEPQYAIVDDDGTHSKPSTVAYRTVSNWLSGAIYSSVTRTANNLWILTMIAPSKQIEHIVWTSGEPQAFTIPADWHVTQKQELMGGKTLLRETSINLGAAPILLH